MLLIERDVNLATQLQQALGFEGLELQTVHSAEEGLSIIRSEHVDLVTMADDMPDQIGEHLLMTLRTSGFRQPLILLTSTNNPYRRIRYYRLGANDVLLKPFLIEEFIERIWNMLKLTGAIGSFYLVKNEGKPLSRDHILAEVWGYDFTGDTNLVDVYIRYLRQKIDRRFKKKYIRTVRGIGYMLEVDKEEETGQR